VRRAARSVRRRRQSALLAVWIADLGQELVEIVVEDDPCSPGVEAARRLLAAQLRRWGWVLRRPPARRQR
jgi:hypothetical protein